jgi:asparagine synthase (glutamine-hydrolysing)
MSAMARLHHRGPDGCGSELAGEAALGHTRLSIVDLTGGQQPMRDPSGRWTLTFNGEIYNYRDLRNELRGAWTFRTRSDTEVLLAGLVTMGTRFIERLDGMWAFGLHDEKSGSTVLSRDRFGKKPLYYRSDGDVFACASEIPALAAMMRQSVWTEDPARIAEYLRYGYPMPGTTCYAGVYEILPGHHAVRESSGDMVQKRYWAPCMDVWRGTVEQASAEIRERLKVAVVKRQLAADVEVGAFLSGGVDSTLVCALAQQSGFGELRTFTAGFNEPTYDERGAASEVAGLLGTVHTDETLGLEEAKRYAQTLPRKLGQPFGDASIVPTAMVSRLAGRHVKVVLTGDGGDEIFGGYARYVGALLRQSYRRLPRLVRSTMERAVLAFPEPVAHHSGSLLKKAHLFVGLVREPESRYLAPAAIRAKVLEQIAPELPACTFEVDLSVPTDTDELRRMMIMDRLVWLPQDILTKVDRATMAHSVEARSPFLDKDLVEFVIRLPWEWHFSGARGKRLLKGAMRDLAPKSVWSRPKQGFASPVAHWMRGSMGDDLIDSADHGSTGALSRDGLLTLLASHRAGEADHSQALWIAYSYLLWRRCGKSF